LIADAEQGHESSRSEALRANIMAKAADPMAGGGR
jgi:hypothetical protein